MKRKEKLSEVEEVLLEMIDLMYQDDFISLYRGLEKLWKRLDNLVEVFNKFCDEHGCNCWVDIDEDDEEDDED